MTKLQFTGGLTTLLFCFALFCDAAASRQIAADVKISYILPQRQLSLNAPVIVTFTVKNESSRPIKLDLGQNRKGGFVFELVQPDGTRIRLPQYGIDGMSRPGTLSVRPGQDFSEKLILNEWYQFKKPGSYGLEARLTQPILFENGLVAAVNTRSVGRIEIGPRNIAKLESVCEKLSEQIEESDSYEDYSDAALELSYVTDPIAVPYLQKAFVTRKLIQPIVIDGLERIGDGTAARALISFLRGENGDTAALIRYALRRIQKETADPALRQEIQTRLGSSS
ncbi:MAG TPA: hypothetical protein VJP02_32010 [Candidatus Sulfotelmatobacter sp.]|nr:hypothetical protein [Candidatus Sulfotelmatobacter sp.]